MTLPDRKETQVRRLLDTALPGVPPGVCPEAVRWGSRIARRRLVAVRLLWLLLFAAVVAFAVWAGIEQPWVEPPSTTTPPLEGW
ncbi:hypothetical protein [Streptomyces sp. NBC_01304]|uniref:hypothetical protein n=1 Tax=Streptomyces sp. NBC_01304 TaxID=2903818 RepID=UPI002E15CA82|nr:hypothetical protein OG430_19410 [Streptomyces sp. NBC_01304]